MGRLDEAIAEGKKANELDPLALPVSSNIGLLLYIARRYDEALEQLHENLEIEQKFCLHALGDGAYLRAAWRIRRGDHGVSESELRFQGRALFHAHYSRARTRWLEKE